MYHHTPLFLLSSLVALGSAASSILEVEKSSHLPNVRVRGTRIVGQVSNLTSNVETFLGIPYAEPPVEDARLRPSILLESLYPEHSVLRASDFGHSCPQEINPLFSPPNTFSEDCLTLNIYRPAISKRHRKMPVLVFIPGGGFMVGGSAMIDGSLMVNQSIVRGTPMMVVTFNYRLGPLGFPQGEEAASEGILNLGMTDQVTALLWVQSNIAYFGGDPTKVTVSGESAGASSLWYHLYGTDLRGSARAVILQSMAAYPLIGTSQGTEKWNQWMTLIPSCQQTLSSTLDCLRSLPNNSSEIFAAASVPTGAEGYQSWSPSVDSRDGLIPDFTSRSLMKNPGISIIMGTNLDEGTLLIPQTVDSDEYIKSFLLQSGMPPVVEGSEPALESLVESILNVYPQDPALGSPYGTGKETFGLHEAYKRTASIVGDVTFQAPSRAGAANFSGAGSPTYIYHFVASGLFPLLPSEYFAPGSLGVSHGADLFASTLYGPLPLLGITDPAALAFSTIMMDYWISFVTSLDPNDGRGVAERPVWNAYDAGNPFLLQLDKQLDQLQMVPADFRAEGIGLINNNPLLLRR